MAADREYRPKNSNFEVVVRESFARQKAMRLIGASLTRVEAGAVDVSLPFRQDLTQQHGLLHGGIQTMVADVACGYAALTLMPEDSEVLTVEFKINLLRPAAGELFVAEARVVRPGNMVTVTRADVYSRGAGGPTLTATMLATMILRPA